MYESGPQIPRMDRRLKLAKNLVFECAETIESLPVALEVLKNKVTFTKSVEATYLDLFVNPMPGIVC